MVISRVHTSHVAMGEACTAPLTAQGGWDLAVDNRRVIHSGGLLQHCPQPSSDAFAPVRRRTTLDRMIPDLEDALTPFRPYAGEREESMWALLMVDDTVHTAIELEGGVCPDDDLYCANLLWILDQAPVDAVVLVVSRHDGRPRAADSAMWQRIRKDARAHRVRYEGMAVVGPSGWSWVDPHADGGTL